MNPRSHVKNRQKYFVKGFKITLNWVSNWKFKRKISSHFKNIKLNKLIEIQSKYNLHLKFKKQFKIIVKL